MLGEKMIEESQDRDYRAGFVAIVGRPNVGKSTLTNALVGQKVAITSNRPETTRHNIRGIVTRPDGQMILVDTPGYHRPRTLLGKRLNEMVLEALADVDVIAMCLPADQKIGPGDRFIAEQISGSRAKKVAIATKLDLVSTDRLIEHLSDIEGLQSDDGVQFDAIVPVSAAKDKNLGTLIDVLISYLPPSPQLYPDDEITDESEETLIAEYVREAALEGVRDELPHSVAVRIDEMVEREGRGDRGILDIYVTIFVERDSQKAIVIGKGGEHLKQVGVKARAEIERLLGRRVYLHTHVTSLKNWQTDPKALRRLGF